VEDNVKNNLRYVSGETEVPATVRKLLLLIVRISASSAVQLGNHKA
jgi:hypothetical protein